MNLLIDTWSFSSHPDEYPFGPWRQYKIRETNPSKVSTNNDFYLVPLESARKFMWGHAKITKCMTYAMSFLGFPTAIEMLHKDMYCEDSKLWGSIRIFSPRFRSNANSWARRFSHSFGKPTKSPTGPGNRKKTAKSNEMFETLEVETWTDFWDARFFSVFGMISSYFVWNLKLMFPPRLGFFGKSLGLPFVSWKPCSSKASFRHGWWMFVFSRCASAQLHVIFEGWEGLKKWQIWGRESLANFIGSGVVTCAFSEFGLRVFEIIGVNWSCVLEHLFFWEASNFKSVDLQLIN